MSWYFYEFVNVRVDSAIAVNSMTHENEWCWWHFVVMFTFAKELCISSAGSEGTSQHVGYKNPLETSVF